MHEVKVKRSLNIKGTCIYWKSMSENIHIKLNCYFTSDLTVMLVT